MQQTMWQDRTDETRWSQSAYQVLVLTAVTLGCIGITDDAHAQSGKLGVYTGTVAVSGTMTENRGKETYHADVKISLPLTEGSSSSAMADMSDVDKPSAMALITQWDVAGKETVPDQRDGKLDSWHCSIAGPTEVPMNASGVLNVDYRAKTHSMSIALVSTRTIPLKCVHSRTGPYKKDMAVSLVIGTTVMGEPFKELPFADPARLAATYKLVPPAETGFGPIDMVWDLRLSR
ncbi:hypothetical protein GALL_262360 [mine drainage metagenome]|uniref:Uncharacterized protein n=1 Tax=mine drainage metagenome TaxID=410659 RepID=A0A1J5R7K8_9ZZZZ